MDDHKIAYTLRPGDLLCSCGDVACEVFGGDFDLVGAFSWFEVQEYQAFVTVLPFVGDFFAVDFH